MVCIGQAVDSDLEVWDIDKDLGEPPLEPPVRKGKSDRQWAPLFCSADFLAEDPVLELEHHVLKDRKIRMLGESYAYERAHSRDRERQGSPGE